MKRDELEKGRSMRRPANDTNRLGSSTTCVACERHSGEPDLEGWHLFSDGADEQYALCAECARARARRYVAKKLFAIPKL